MATPVSLNPVNVATPLTTVTSVSGPLALSDPPSPLRIRAVTVVPSLLLSVIGVPFVSNNRTTGWVSNKAPDNSPLILLSAGCVVISILPPAAVVLSKTTLNVPGKTWVVPLVVVTVALTITVPAEVDRTSKSYVPFPLLGIVIVEPVGFVLQVPSPEIIVTTTDAILDVSVSWAPLASLSVTVTGTAPSCILFAPLPFGLVIPVPPFPK